METIGRMERRTGKNEGTGRKEENEMEYRKKKAWIYTHIDAPEDSHGTLKQQYGQLNIYREQLGLEIAGCSSDLGGTTGLERPGLSLFLEERESREIEVLLVLDSSRLSRDEKLRQGFLFQMEKCGIEVYSPLEGMISAKRQ